MRRLIETWLGRDRGALLLRLIAENAWEHRWGYAAAMVLMATVAAMGGAVALVVERVTDEVFFEQRLESLTPVAVTVMAIFMIRGAAMFGQLVLLNRIGNRIVARLQARVYAHVLSQGIDLHAQETTGDLSTRLSHNANAARAALHLVATRLGVDLLTVMVLVGVMFWQDWRMAMVALLGLPAILGGVAALVQRVKKLARAEVTMNARILSAMAETVQGARIIRAFGLERRMTDHMGAAIEGVRDRTDRIGLLLGLVNPLMETVAGLAAAGVILYGGWRVAEDGLAVGTFFSFLTALIMVGDPGRRIAQLNVQLRQHLAGAEFLYAILDRRAGVREAPGARALSPGPGEIRLSDLHFSYGAEPVLAGLSLTAPAGQVTALVGPSGGGKSTVLALIERFFDPDAGTIAIDGQDIRGVTLQSLRARLALVTQDTFLFDATAAENIGFGRIGASRAEIEAAAQAANAHDFLSALPQGYDTPLGEGGARLSGGQRQRLAIARAMLRDAPILLLDEATSALDAETEARVQEALSRLMRGRTTLVVAHRLATIRQADKICVVEAGRVVEEGTHAVLIARGGLYARLAALQTGPDDATLTEAT